MATMTSLEIIPDAADIYLGDTVQYQALATYDDNSVVDVTDLATWVVISSPTIATFSGTTPGLLIGSATGSGSVVCNYGGFSPSTSGTLDIHNPLIIAQPVDLVDEYRPSVTDYLGLFTSQYQTSTKLLAWAKGHLDIVMAAKELAENLVNYFSFNRIIDNTTPTYVENAFTVKENSEYPYDFVAFEAAIGDQLDVLGVILGVGRTVDFNPTGGASPILDDDTYRILLKARVIMNHWNGKAASLQEKWKELFPGGKIVIQDNQNMTVSVTIYAGLSQMIVDLITNEYIVPRPQGVLMNYYYGTTPFFGFDRDDTYVSGFDTGNWV